MLRAIAPLARRCYSISRSYSQQNMDEIVKRSIATADSKKKSPQSVPWTADVPYEQPWFRFNLKDQQWTSNREPEHASQTPSKVALYSWNIDFMLPFANSRMRRALQHLREDQIQGLDPDTAVVIYLQECVESDISLLKSEPWIQNTFTLSDTTTQNWQSGHYGTITLLSRNISILKAFRVHYSQTRMERDVLILDVQLHSKTLRFCNTHLESLALEAPYRPPQMQLTAQYMHDSRIHGAAAAGDFNAIQDFDRMLHSDNGLKDAYLELGGDEDDADGGHTWGQQAATFQREKFGTSRMDKVFFCGGLRCLGFERFGAGVEVDDVGEREELVRLGFDRPWITDHLGVKAVFEVEDGLGKL